MTSDELGASIEASLELHLGNLNRFTAELRRQRAEDRVMQPVHRHYALAQIVANGLAIFEFPGPDQGHRWEVRNIFVSGVTRATSEPGAVDVFVSAQSLALSLSGGAVTLAAIGTGDQRDFLSGSSGAGSQTNNFSGTGSTISVTVPAGQTWNLAGISFTYTASAAVANRNVRVRINDSAGRNLYTFVDSTALTANQIGLVSLAPGNPTQHTLATGSTFIIQGNLPAGLQLPPGAIILIDAIGIDAADTMTLGTIQYSLSGGVLPVSRQYSRMQMAIYPLENPVVIVSGATNAHELHCVLDIEDFQLGNIPVVEAT